MKKDQIGTEVRCWDCHEMVLVPLPSQGQQLAHELSTNALVVIKGPGLNTVFCAAAVVTAVLCIPNYGAWCAIAVLAMGASAYGEIIRRISRGPSVAPVPSWLRSLLPLSIVKAILCVAMAAGTVIPLWIWNSGFAESPHFDGKSRLIVATTWLILPLLMMLVHCRTIEGSSLGLKSWLILLARHPIAVFLALAVVPFTLVLTELLLDLIFYIPGNLPFFALDFMPMPRAPEGPRMSGGIPHYNQVDYRTLPNFMFIKGYFNGLRHGYSFVSAIPASLANQTRADLNPEAIGALRSIYAVIRVLITMVIVTCLISAFAVQARWLGALPARDRRRSA